MHEVRVITYRGSTAPIAVHLKSIYGTQRATLKD